MRISAASARNAFGAGGIRRNQMKKNNNNYLRNGFTLIELLVVVAIIGILAGIVLVSMSGSRASARDGRRMTDFGQLSRAMEIVMNDDGAYVRAAGPAMPAIKNISNYQYLAALADPGSSSSYQYVWAKNTGTGNCGSLREGQYFCAVTKLEQKGSCAANEFHYFVSNQTARKERCDTNDYVANTALLQVCACAAW